MRSGRIAVLASNDPIEAASQERGAFTAGRSTPAKQVGRHQNHEKSCKDQGQRRKIGSADRLTQNKRA